MAVGKAVQWAMSGLIGRFSGGETPPPSKAQRVGDGQGPARRVQYKALMTDLQTGIAAADSVARALRNELAHVVQDQQDDAAAGSRKEAPGAVSSADLRAEFDNVRG